MNSNHLKCHRRKDKFEKKKIVRNESIFKPEKLLNEICHDVVEIETETICFIANVHTKWCVVLQRLKISTLLDSNKCYIFFQVSFFSYLTAHQPFLRKIMVFYYSGTRQITYVGTFFLVNKNLFIFCCYFLIAWGPNKNKKKLFMNHQQNYSVNSSILITQPKKVQKTCQNCLNLHYNLRSFTESSPNANSRY